MITILSPQSKTLIWPQRAWDIHCSVQLKLNREMRFAVPADPAISRIVADECAKRDIPYAHYDTLPQIIGRFTA